MVFFYNIKQQILARSLQKNVFLYWPWSFVCVFACLSFFELRSQISWDLRSELWKGSDLRSELLRLFKMSNYSFFWVMNGTMVANGKRAEVSLHDRVFIITFVSNLSVVLSHFPIGTLLLYIYLFTVKRFSNLSWRQIIVETNDSKIKTTP